MMSMLLAAAALVAGQAPPAPPVVPIRASKVVLVGDSTTAVSGGWGGSFCAEHVASFLACVSLARGGRSWWSYRAGSRGKNLGWRIDYHLVAKPMESRLKNVRILPDALHSDHCPVLLELQ